MSSNISVSSEVTKVTLTTSSDNTISLTSENAPKITISPVGVQGPSGVGGEGSVDSVNGQTGVVVLDTDDIDDSTQINKYTTSGDISKLAGIEVGAQINTVDSVNAKTGVVVINPDDLDDSATVNKFVTAAQIIVIDNQSGVNTGDQDLSGIETDISDLETAILLIEGDQGTQDVAIALNTNKISFDSVSSTRLANTSGTNTGDQDISGIATNAADIASIEAEQIAQNDDIVKNKNGGFLDYNDTSTLSAPVSLISNTWTTIPNDGLGAFTNKNYLPYGVNELIDTSTGAIDPTELGLGDYILIRNDFTVTPSTNNSSLEFRYTLGTGAGAYTLEKRLGRLDQGSGTSYRFSLGVDEIYMGDTNTRDNHIGLQVRLSSNGTLINAGSAISVIRYTV